MARELLNYQYAVKEISPLKESTVLQDIAYDLVLCKQEAMYFNVQYNYTLLENRANPVPR